MNKLVVVGVLVVLSGCAGAWLAASEQDHGGARWFSKDGKSCAMVRYNDSIGEWNVYSGETSIFVEEKDAVAFARNMCGGGDIRIAKVQ